MFLKVIYLFETSYFCQFRLCLGWTFGWRDFGWKCCNQIRICLNLHSWKSVNLLGGPLEKLESRGLDQMYSHPSLHQLPALWDINLSPRIKRELYSTTDLVGELRISEPKMKEKCLPKFWKQQQCSECSWMEFLFITPSTIIIPFGNFYFPSFSSSEMWSLHLVFFPVIRGESQ